MKKFIAAALLSAVSAISTGALAEPATLNGEFEVSNLSSGTYDATFSLPSSLPENYLINSLFFSFSFMDDSDIWKSSLPVIDSTTSTAYKHEGWFSSTYSRDTKVEQTVNRIGEEESVVLSLAGNEVGSGATALVESSSKSSTGPTRVYDKTECTLFIFCADYYSDISTFTTTVTKDWNGVFTIEGTVASQDILDQLLRDNALLVSLNVSGDLVLTGARLELDYTEVEPAPVPEPSSILLSLIGLGGIGFMRRRGAGGRV